MSTSTQNLGIYDPLFYATEALIILYKKLGMANAVYRGFDSSPQQKGSHININRPTTFVAAAMPVTTPTDLNPDTVQIVLNQWYGVTFALTDQQLTYTKEKIIMDHLNPAAFAVADQIDQTICQLYVNVPWSFSASATFVLTDLTAVRQIMFNNRVPIADRHLMVNGEREAGMLNLDTFNIVTRSSDGAATQRDGFIGNKFGFEVFSNQNVQVSVANNVAITGTLTLSSQPAIGALSVAMSASTTGTGTFVVGDILTFSGVVQQYVVTAAATFAGNAATVSIFPAIGARGAAQPANGATVTIISLAKNQNLAFHRNAFALAMAPLSELGDGVGARIATAVDPVTNLALRSRVWYDGTNAKLNIGIDALWGVQCLDPNLAVRYQS